MKRISVILAEDHAMVRESLRTLLSLEPDIEVVGEAENGRLAVELTLKLKPAVVVMDIAMPVINGLEATRQILQLMPQTKVLILSAHSDEAYFGLVIAIGASGYLVKLTAADFLAKAIRVVAEGKAFFSSSVARQFTHHDQMARAQSEPGPEKDATRLSSREKKVLRFVAEGQANIESAKLLKISVETIEKHRQSLMEKLNIHDTAGLTRYAISAGIIESTVQVTII